MRSVFFVTSEVRSSFTRFHLEMLLRSLSVRRYLGGGIGQSLPSKDDLDCTQLWWWWCSKFAAVWSCGPHWSIIFIAPSK